MFSIYPTGTLAAPFEDARRFPFSEPSAITRYRNASEWAITHIEFVRSLQIMGGVGFNRFDPYGNFTREQSILTMLRIWDLSLELSSPADSVPTPIGGVSKIEHRERFLGSSLQIYLDNNTVNRITEDFGILDALSASGLAAAVPYAPIIVAALQFNQLVLVTFNRGNGVIIEINHTGPTIWVWIRAQ